MANQAPVKQKGKSKKIVIIAAAVAVVAAGIGVFAIGGMKRNISAEHAVADASALSVSAADLRIAVVRMDDIQKSAKILADLRKQRESLESDLKSDLERKQKKLESEKKAIESQQGILSREALQQRVVEYQRTVGEFQKEIAERAQAIDASFQAALLEIQEKHLDPVIDALAAKKGLDLIMDARFTRVVSKAPGLDITNEIIAALDKKATKFNLKVK
ncbi:MAG: OmpH family outer membrane protein [Rickettsiales bacterium]|jgi:Skp family chaperone for outer membrane proteins|nr:OmpH family outer membrane protein [Rickettsiales bacterium]